MELFINNNLDAAYNLALEEFMTRNHNSGFLMLWRNANAIIVGRNQNTAAEINAEKVREFDTVVIRRSTGGGAVYHDVGNLNYSIAVPGKLVAHESFAEFARPVVEALKVLGVDAVFSGRNDILVDGRKVSGNAFHQLPDRSIVHGTLLYDTDLDALEEAIRPPVEKLERHGVASVRQRVRNLKEYLDPVSVEALERHLVEYFCDGEVTLTEEDVAKIEAMASEYEIIKY